MGIRGEGNSGRDAAASSAAAAALLLLLLLLSLKFKAYKVIKLYATSFVSETKKEIDTARDRDRGWIEGGNSGSFSRKCWAFLDRLLLSAVVAAAYC